LRAHSRHAPWNARGLAAHVTALVDAAGVRPTNASARAAPSARSIRFYIANGLLERPEGTGTAATYNYRHFLQLLAIKIRQREGITLDAIKVEMKEVTGDALEQLGPRRAVPERVERDLGAVPQVVEKDRVHLRTERRVQDHERRFVIERHRAIVEVHRPDRRPQPVSNDRLRVQHRGLILVH